LASSVELLRAESERIERESRSNPDAHDLATRAFSIWYRTAPDATDEPRQLALKAIELDPECTFAWVMAETTLARTRQSRAAFVIMPIRTPRMPGQQPMTSQTR
jgi:hypothetical protein